MSVGKDDEVLVSKRVQVEKKCPVVNPVVNRVLHLALQG